MSNPPIVAVGIDGSDKNSCCCEVGTRRGCTTPHTSRSDPQLVDPATPGRSRPSAPWGSAMSMFATLRNLFSTTRPHALRPSGTRRSCHRHAVSGHPNLSPARSG